MVEYDPPDAIPLIDEATSAAVPNDVKHDIDRFKTVASDAELESSKFKR